ncbi:MAG: hypothetical protein RBS81_12345, partial [Tenuifilaceae bacterium]|nr:hypothetical protein [Tenuifilaceae bacterium]
FLFFEVNKKGGKVWRLTSGKKYGFSIFLCGCNQTNLSTVKTDHKGNCFLPNYRIEYASLPLMPNQGHFVSIYQEHNSKCQRITQIQFSPLLC